MKNIVLFVIACGWLQFTTAQTKTLTVRNAFEDPSETAEPAKLSFNLPNTGSNTFLINLGIKYDWTYNANGLAPNMQKQFKPGFIATYNRNNQIDAEQHNYKIGGALEINHGRNGGGIVDMHYWNITAQYLRNVVDSSNALLATAYYSYAFGDVNSPAGKIFINNFKRIGPFRSRLFYNLAPSVGGELQHIFQDTKVPNGFQFRAYANAAAMLALRSKTKAQRRAAIPVTNSYVYPLFITLSAQYIVRQALINSVAGSDSFIPLFKSVLTFYPTKDQNLSLALSYSDGSDPVAGLAKQTFWQFGVQFQLN